MPAPRVRPPWKPAKVDKRVYFKEYLPLVLRNKVSPSSAFEESVDRCTQEQMMLFDCLKLHDFDDNVCAKEIQAFSDCNSRSKKAERDIRERRKQGTLTPGARKMTAAQANVLLKRYPQWNDPSIPKRWP